MEMVGKLHKMPHNLVSDRDPLFVSHLWQELFKLSGSKLRMSSAYHPQSNRQTELSLPFHHANPRIDLPFALPLEGLENQPIISPLVVLNT